MLMSGAEAAGFLTMSAGSSKIQELHYDLPF